MPVYMIHWSKPGKKATHYLGCTNRTVEERFNEHVKGYGGKYTGRLVRWGWRPVLAFVWPKGDFALEKLLKKTGYSRFCPECFKQ